MSLHSQKTCPRCDTPLTGEEAACPQCRRPLAGPKLASAPGDKPVCPICKLPVYEASLAGLPALHCAECKGLGLKRKNMMKLQPYGPKEVAAGAEERDYKRPQFFEPRKKPPFLICPFCKKKMKGTTLAKFSVDICEECAALWLEEGKVEFLNDITGPYKWKVSSEKK